MFLVFLLSGCGDSTVTQALDSDSNGYFCPKCQAKFFTERSLFADYCPQCQNTDIQTVVGYVCAKDGQVTLAGRAKGMLPCAKCRQPTAGLKMPSAKDLTAWGAAKKTAREVGGNR